MAAWTCPRCDRTFGRQGQGHVCAPAVSIDAYYADRPAYERDVHDAVIGHLSSLGAIDVEAVGVGVLVKGRRTFVELRPKRDRVALSIVLSHPVTHPRVRRMTGFGRGSPLVAVFVDLRSVDDVDGDVRAWLSESFAEFAGFAG